MEFFVPLFYLEKKQKKKQKTPTKPQRNKLAPVANEVINFTSKINNFSLTLIPTGSPLHRTYRNPAFQ